MRFLRHQRRLVKAGKDELELARIPVDVADGENARDIGLEARRVDRDELVVLQLDSPIRQRTELHGQPEERQHRIAGDIKSGTVVGFDHGVTDLAVCAGERSDLPKHEIDFALADQRHHLVDAVRRGAEFAAPMQQREVFRQRRQIERPIERAVAAADNKNALVAQRLHLAYRVEYRLALVRLDAGNGRPLRLERTAARGDDDDLADKFLAEVGLYAKQRIADLLHRLDHFAEMILGAERFDLLQQVVDQTLRAGMGDARNIVDRLFGIQLGALTTDLVENVDQVGLHVEQAKFEYGKQADRASTNNDDVGIDRFTHVMSCS